MGTLGPPGQEVGGRRERITASATFTLAGAVASASVGSALGALGAWTLMPVAGLATVAVVLLAVIAAAREFGFISVPLVQPRRQTNPCWKVRGRRVAGLLWGLDLGLVFTTWFTFAGPWVLLAMAFAMRDPTIGASLFVAYWLGRALPVWIAPLLLRGTTTLGMLRQLSQQYRYFQVMHASALLWVAALLLISLSIN